MLALPRAVLRAMRPERPAPPTLGRYRLHELIGEGGFGQVYRAHDPVLGRDVAIKVARDAFWSADETLEEARALARLSHPSVVQVLDAGRDGGTAWLVMEHVDGRDLEQHLGSYRDREILSRPALALAVLEGPAAALDHVHRQGTLHGDLKPGNLLVPRPLAAAWLRGDQAGPDAPGVKVADFGLSALAARHGPQAAARACVGDPRHVAPEAWLGRPDRTSDIHALATIFFRLVARRHPLPADTPEEMVVAAGRPERLRLREVRPEMPAALDAALAAALSPRRHDRPRTAVGLLESLRQSLAQAGRRRSEVEDARSRIAARNPAARASCAACRRPLHPRAESCPHCGEPA